MWIKKRATCQTISRNIMRHSRKSTRVISLINQLQPGINVNEENQPVTRGGRGEEEGEEGTCCRRERVSSDVLIRIGSTRWVISFLFFFFFFFPPSSQSSFSTWTSNEFPTCSILAGRSNFAFISFQPIPTQSEWKIVKSLARFSKARYTQIES